MKSSSIMRRTLPLMIALLLIIGIAVSCTLLTGKKLTPNISNPKEVVLQNDFITITNEEVYKSLVMRFGESSTFRTIDRYILADVNGKNYLDLVTDEEIEEEFHKQFGDPADFDDEEDKEELLEIRKYNIYFSTGFKTEEEVNDYFRLQIAKKLYARDVATKTVDTDEKKYGDKEYNDELKANYKADAAAIVIPFKTQHELKVGLEQLGIEQSTASSRKWRWIEDKKDLTYEEIKQAFIDLYNSVFASKVPTYPLSQLTIQEGEHYTVVDGKIVFHYDDFNRDSIFVYTQEQLEDRGIDSLIYNDLESAVDADKEITEPEEGEEEEKIVDFIKTYTPKFNTTHGGFYQLVLKIDQAETNKLENELESGLTIEEEIRQSFIDKLVTDSYVKEQMVKLRNERNLVIYEPVIATMYSMQDPDFVEPKKGHKTIVAKIDGLTITADDLYADLFDLHSANYIEEKLTHRYMLNSEYNDFFDMATDKFTNKEARKKYNDEFKDMKAMMKQEYAYNYSQFFTMEQYLQYVYNISNIEDRKYDLFYRDIMKEYRDDFSKIEDNWDHYLELMEKEKEDFYEAKAIHLLITIYENPYAQNDADRKPIDPENWTDYQKSLAEELYDEITLLFEKEITGKISYKTVMEHVEKSFKEAPFLMAGGFTPDSHDSKPLYIPDKLLQEVDYTYSKYKSAGLAVKFEELGTIGPDTPMVKPFLDAVEYMWKVNETDNKHGDNKDRLYDNSDDPYLITEFGYHLLVIQNTVAYQYADRDDKLLPTLEQVLDYFDEDKRDDLSTRVKNAIRDNFIPLYNERKGVADEEGEMDANLADISVIESVLELVEGLTLDANLKDDLLYYLQARIYISTKSLKHTL